MFETDFIIFDGEKWYPADAPQLIKRLFERIQMLEHDLFIAKGGSENPVSTDRYITIAEQDHTIDDDRCIRLG